MSEASRRQLATRVERLRLSRGIDVGALAARSRRMPEEIEAILAGEADLDLATVLHLAGALEASPHELLHGISPMADGEFSRLAFMPDPPPPGRARRP